MKRVSFLNLVVVLAGVISLDAKGAENSKTYECEWTFTGNKVSEVVTYEGAIFKSYTRTRTFLCQTDDNRNMEFIFEDNGGAHLRSKISYDDPEVQDRSLRKFLDFPYRFGVLEPLILKHMLGWQHVKNLEIIPGMMEKFDPMQNSVGQGQKGYRTKLTINVEF
jgi:hypothetical protein